MPLDSSEASLILSVAYQTPLEVSHRPRRSFLHFHKSFTNFLTILSDPMEASQTPSEASLTPSTASLSIIETFQTSSEASQNPYILEYL